MIAQDCLSVKSADSHGLRMPCRSYQSAGRTLRSTQFARQELNLVRRDSSVTTGVCWWEHPDFAHKHVLAAAELVAFEVFNPSLRSRGTPQAPARELYEDEVFRARVTDLFQGEPAGQVIIPTLENALERIAALEQRVAELERRVGETG